MRYGHLILLAFALTLTGCGWQEAGEKIAVKRKTTEQRFEEIKNPTTTAVKPKPLTVTDDVWYGTQAVKLRQGLPLPASVETPKAIALVSATPLSLESYASSIGMQTGLAVQLIDGAGQKISPSAEGQIPNTQQGAVPSVIGGPGVPQPAQGMPVAYMGPLSGLLDQVSGGFGVDWHYDGRTIFFSRYKTRTFSLLSLPGEQSTEDGLSANDDNGSGSGSSGSSGTQQVDVDVTQDATMSVKLKFWDEFSTAVRTLLAGDGTYTISPSSGTVTVIATPDKMSKIAEYIADENKRLGRQVAINVEVYTVSLSDLNQFGLDLDLIFRASPSAPIFGFSGPPTGLTTGTFGGLSSMVLPPLGSNLPSPKPGSTVSKFGNSSLVVQGLAQVGDVTRVAQIPLITMNNRPAATQFVTNRAYLARVEVTQVEGGGSTTELTPGNIQTGVSLQVIPRIQDDDRTIQLQYSLTMRDQLGDLANQSSGSGANQQTIQLPTTQARIFVQQAQLCSGCMVVLAGFEQQDNSRSRNGMGHPMNWLLGGGQDVQEGRQVMVVAITATEIDVKRSKEN